jgi:hypothetical protein
MSSLVRWLWDEPRIEDPSAGMERVREAMAQAYVDAQSAYVGSGGCLERGGDVVEV